MDHGSWNQEEVPRLEGGLGTQASRFRRSWSTAGTTTTSVAELSSSRRVSLVCPFRVEGLDGTRTNTVDLLGIHMIQDLQPFCPRQWRTCRRLFLVARGVRSPKGPNTLTLHMLFQSFSHIVLGQQALAFHRLHFSTRFHRSFYSLLPCSTPRNPRVRNQPEPKSGLPRRSRTSSSRPIRPGRIQTCNILKAVHVKRSDPSQDIAGPTRPESGKAFRSARKRTRVGFLNPER